MFNGFTWLDWALALLVLMFAVRGIFRGSVRQVFAFLGGIGAVWIAMIVSRWVEAHWQGARPAVVFVVLRWVVAGLAALAVASLVTWWGERSEERRVGKECRSRWSPYH